jgi:hypothetical protein
MAQVQKKAKVVPDRFLPDGTRLFNPTKPHGVVYYDAAYGECPTRFVQELDGREVHYAADGRPVGYEPGKPLPPPVDEVQAENESLKSRIKDLEGQNTRILALLEKLTGEPKPAAQPVPAAEGRPGGAAPGKK